MYIYLYSTCDATVFINKKITIGIRLKTSRKKLPETNYNETKYDY